MALLAQLALSALKLIILTERFIFYSAKSVNSAKSIFLHGDIDDIGDIANFATFANAFFLFGNNVWLFLPNQLTYKR